MIPSIDAIQPQWLTTAQAAPLLGCTKQTVRKMCAEKQIQRMRVGERYLIHTETIRAWIREHLNK